MYPKKLYKYRKFDKFTKRMLINGELFLCPANKLDDQFDCAVNFAKEKIVNMSNKEIEKKSLDIVKKVLPCYLSNDKMEKSLFILDTDDKLETLNMINPKGIDNGENKIALEYLEKIPMEIEKQMNENINAKQKLENSILSLINIQKEIGIASLSTTNTNQVLWSMYSNDYKGYCIEYEIPDNVNDLYKVSYEKDKEFDVIEMVLLETLHSFYSLILNSDKKYSLIDNAKNISLIKFNEWSFQDEWRFIGKAKEYKYLKIKAVYLGKNISKKHQIKIINIAKKMRYEIYKCYDDYENFKIKFKQIF